MTDTKPNAELAYRVLDHIDAHPKLWRQSVYIGPSECGTVACFAGWACMLSGEEPEFVNGPEYSTASLRGGQVVSDRAQDLLGASRWLADHTDDADDERDLFDEWNDRETLGDLVAEIFGPRPAVAS